MSNSPNIQGLMDGQQWTWELYIDHMLNVTKLSNQLIILTTNESLFMRWWAGVLHTIITSGKYLSGIRPISR